VVTDVANKHHENRRDSPLGTLINSTATSQSAGGVDRRLERVELRVVARRVVPGHRVADCGCGLIPGASAVKVLYAVAQEKAHYGNLKNCGAVWVCPVCAAKISERRRGEVRQAIDAHHARGGTILIVAYTVSHKRHNSLQDVLAGFLKAQERMQGNRPYRRLAASYGLVGSIKSLEVTYGDTNGWHPHAHTLLFFDRAVDVAAFQDGLYAAWEGAAAGQGLTMTRERGVLVQSAWGKVQEYVAKWGHEPTRPVWDSTAEMTKGHIKRAADEGDGQRFTPFDLLRWVKDTGDLGAAALFREFAAAFHGRRQLVWSPGLRAALGVGDEKSDEELVAEQTELGVTLGMIDREPWRAVCHYNAQGQVLHLADGGEWGPVVAFIDSLVERYGREARGPT